ncbi:hypothetical protein SMC26_13475 [Actinomadura fulvescens]|uniref:ORC-CDC6 family AAA ATPase n=1 Tax=Actinomadura fulvescens TaxID=46160 RepID=UPI0031D0DCA0
MTQIPRRAEQHDQRELGATFVDIGPLFAGLKRPEHQVMYGRRGTGKTHALGKLQNHLADQGVCVCYLDMRTVGSAGGIYSDPWSSLAERATPLLVDVVEALHNSLTDYALELLSTDQDVTALFSALDNLGDAATEVEVVGSTEVEETRQNSEQTKGSKKLKLSPLRPSLDLELGSTSDKSRSRSARFKVSGDVRFTVKFGPLAKAMARVVRAIPGRRIWLLLDEWSALPIELQPFLADLLRRALFPVQGVVVKIAAVERRSAFCIRGEQRDYLGIELGADVSQDINLDDYLVFSQGDSRATEFFGDLFLRHAAAISEDVAEAFPLDANGRRKFIWALFASTSAFEEAIQAAEGVPRDGINIVSLALQRASSQTGIEIDDIRYAARAWFLRDKEGAIRSDKMASRALMHIVKFAAERRKRFFLIERGHDSNHEVIQALYDARVIHLINSSVGAGGAYDLFALDYGGYVNLLSFHEASTAWRDEWAENWVDYDPARSATVREAILRVSDLREKPQISADEPL